MKRTLESLNDQNRRVVLEYYTRNDEVLELLEAKINDDSPLNFAEPKHLYRRDDADIDASQCQQILRKLDNRGFVDRIETGKYVITERGEQRLEEIRSRDLTKTFDSETEDDIEADPDELDADKVGDE